MLVIAAGDTLAGVAGTATAITVTATGVSVDATTGSETLGKLYQGQLPNAAATLFTVPVGQSYVIKTLTVANNSGSSVSGIKLFLSGTAAANTILGPITLENGTTATFGENGWQVSDTNGQILVASITGGITQLTGDVTAGPGSGSQAATVVKVNGGAVPVSAVVLGSNASSQPVAATTTGSGTTAVLATSPTFVTSATSPIVYGGSAAGSTLTLDGTSNGSPSSAYVLINPSGQGNVGIGTSAPLFLFQTEKSNANTTIDSSANRFIMISNPDTTNNNLAFLGFQSKDSSGNFQKGAFVGGSWHNRTASLSPCDLVLGYSTGNQMLEQMRITSAGLVGIGTTTPHSKLAVVGLPVYANNAAAITGGLAAGDFYRDGSDPDHVCIVH